MGWVVEERSGEACGGGADADTDGGVKEEGALLGDGLRLAAAGLLVVVAIMDKELEEERQGVYVDLLVVILMRVGMVKAWVVCAARSCIITVTGSSSSIFIMWLDM